MTLIALHRDGALFPALVLGLIGLLAFGGFVYLVYLICLERWR